MSHFDTAYVYADLERFHAPFLMGELHRQKSRSGDIFSFHYEKAWLAGEAAFAFDTPISLWSQAINTPRLIAQILGYFWTLRRIAGARC
jgi:hypothetical protein